jgi:hypothetical protein
LFFSIDSTDPLYLQARQYLKSHQQNGGTGIFVKKEQKDVDPDRMDIDGEEEEKHGESNSSHAPKRQKKKKPTAEEVIARIRQLQQMKTEGYQ